LDTSETRVEKIPLIVKPVSNIVLKRVDPGHSYGGESY
jgi:KUP system potassium uptake protein